MTLGRWVCGGVGVIERLRAEQSLGNLALILHLTLLSGHRVRPFSELWDKIGYSSTLLKWGSLYGKPHYYERTLRNLHPAMANETS